MLFTCILVREKFRWWVLLSLIELLNVFWWGNKQSTWTLGRWLTSPALWCSSPGYCTNAALFNQNKYLLFVRGVTCYFSLNKAFFTRAAGLQWLLPRRQAAAIQRVAFSTNLIHENPLESKITMKYAAGSIMHNVRVTFLQSLRS